MDDGHARAVNNALNRAFDHTCHHNPQSPLSWSTARLTSFELIQESGATGRIGVACSRALTQALKSADPGPTHYDLATAFIDLLIQEFDLGTSAYHPSLDTLGGTCTQAADVLRQRISTLEDQNSRAWVDEVARRLPARAVPVLERREELTPQIATEIRLSALILAVEADAMALNTALGEDFHTPGAAFRALAAGVTLMQRRRNGEAPAPETIMLVPE